ncbi:Fic family protein [Sediminivirga luteola]|uniref:Fic family protein n=1 Tax=Sediminivirga luteola TaxID=1774748 RepID=UPI001F5624BD|nr:Fic family protein [Sediminivirga luteola]MCI2265874.1 Fic family protein [Sediminivirga luteola]
MAVQDPYAYPGTDVLINIPGFTDPEGWKKAETAVIAQRLGELADHPISGNFDLAHLQAIHARLVEGFYTWGGQLRTTDTGPGGTGLAHCRPEFIPAEAERIFTALHRMDYLRGREGLLKVRLTSRLLRKQEGWKSCRKSSTPRSSAAPPWSWLLAG